MIKITLRALGPTLILWALTGAPLIKCFVLSWFAVAVITDVLYPMIRTKRYRKKLIATITGAFIGMFCFPAFFCFFLAAFFIFTNIFLVFWFGYYHNIDYMPHWFLDNVLNHMLKALSAIGFVLGGMFYAKRYREF